MTRPLSIPFLVFIGCLLGLASCEISELDNQKVAISLEKGDFQLIADLQDRRDTKNLLLLFSDENPSNRYLAAKAFASFQDSTAIDSLIHLLDSEPNKKVRAVAAYALGQQQSSLAAQAIVKRFTKEKSRAVQGMMLEAMGKCGDSLQLANISKVKTYKLQDTALLVGQAKSIFRFGLRGITSPVGTEKMVDFVANAEMLTEARLYAAVYLQRFKNIDLSIHERGLSSVFEKEEDPDIRMFLALALGKTKGTNAKDALLTVFDSEGDYRVKVNILRALTNFPYLAVKDTIIRALDEKSPHVALQAARFLKEKGIEKDLATYLELAEAQDNWRARAELFATLLAKTPAYKTKANNFFSRQIIEKFKESTNPYEKGALLTALSEYPPNYRFIRDIVFTSKDTVLQTYGMEAIVNCRKSEKFPLVYKTMSLPVKQEFAKILRDAIASGDVALMGIAASLIREPAYNYNKYFVNYEFMEEAMKRLNLPKDMETYYELQKALSFIKGEPAPINAKPKFNNPIEWRTLKGMEDTIKMTIKTIKGEIGIHLYPLEAPGSVANFVKLTQEEFFNGKNFHRVVPNFVAQGGCPRGDGWGSLDYSIRSELGPLYYNKEGWIGMASTGNDTESTQWFITHSPTPHLDGRYTIFGKVVEGLSVIHTLDIGDIIQEITLD